MAGLGKIMGKEKGCSPYYYRKDAMKIAQEHFMIIQPILTKDLVGKKEIDRIAQDAGVHFTTIYRWLRLYRACGVQGLVLSKRGVKKGSMRISAEAELLMNRTIEERAKHGGPEKKVTAIIHEVRERCEKSGVKPPHANTIRMRINERAERILNG